jgi:hypothetical protein
MVDEVGSSSFEDFMGQNVNPHVDVAGQSSRVFVALPVEDVVVGVRNSLLDGHFQGLFRLLDPLAFAALAFVLLIHDHSHLAAGLAGRLHLGIHSRAQLSHLQDDAVTLAVGTLFGVDAALSLAVSAHPQSAHLHFLHLPHEHLLQSHVDFHQLRLGLPRPLLFLLLEDVVEEALAASGRSSILHSFLAVLVVKLSLLGVEQSVVGFLQMLELGWISALIGVFFQGSFPEGFLDLFSGGILGNLQQFVVLCCIDLTALGTLVLV